MALKPVKIVEWATNLLNVVEPTAGKKIIGWLVAEKPPAQYFNFLLNVLGQWSAYLDDIENHGLVWTVLQTFNDRVEVTCSSPDTDAVTGIGNGLGAGVIGVSGNAGPGVKGVGAPGNNRGGVFLASGSAEGVLGSGVTGPGVKGLGNVSAPGVLGQGVGVGNGVFGTSPAGSGVFGQGGANGHSLTAKPDGGNKTSTTPKNLLNCVNEDALPRFIVDYLGLPNGRITQFDETWRVETTVAGSVGGTGLPNTAGWFHDSNAVGAQFTTELSSGLGPFVSGLRQGKLTGNSLNTTYSQLYTPSIIRPASASIFTASFELALDLGLAASKASVGFIDIATTLSANRSFHSLVGDRFLLTKQPGVFANRWTVEYVSGGVADPVFDTTVLNVERFRIEFVGTFASGLLLQVTRVYLDGIKRYEVTKTVNARLGFALALDGQDAGAVTTTAIISPIDMVSARAFGADSTL